MGEKRAMAEEEETRCEWKRQSGQHGCPRSHCLGGDCNMCSAGEGESRVLKCAQEERYGQWAREGCGASVG